MPCACTTSPVAGAPGLAAGPPEPGTQENAEAPGRVDPARGRRRFGAGAPSARSARFARPHPALVAQLERASDYGSEGWGFESLRARKSSPVTSMSLEWEQVIVDALDPVALGTWWRDALGWVVVNEDPEEFEIRPDPDRVPGLLFARVPERKTLKNRLHLDFR